MPEKDESAPLVPQLLASSAETFIPAARELGFGEVNLNLGCPSRIVTAKRKGAGLLADLPALDGLLGQIFEVIGEGPPRISVKTRMGSRQRRNSLRC